MTRRGGNRARTPARRPGGPGRDVLDGGGGADTLHATDEVHGNDTVDGGAGTDTCDADTGDRVTSCP